MNKNKRDIFVYIWSCCLIVIVFISIFSIVNSLRGTHAYFGDGTTGTFTVHTVYYNSKYPDDVLLVDDSYADKQDTNNNILLENMFVVPDGYMFDGWYDEDGIRYMPGDEKNLKKDILMIAGWKKIDEVIISYGDVNLNGVIDEDDYNLVSLHIDGSNILISNALINADVNSDGKVDLIDVDIIKNAFLGTNGYVGYLPSKPILIYDIYEGNIDIENGEIGDDNQLGEDGGENNSSGDSSNDNGTGNGSSGSGNGNVTGGGNTSSNGVAGGSGNSSSNGSSSNNQVSEDKNNNENKDVEDENVIEKKIFKFKYMNGKVEFDNTSCETNTDSCLIVLPDKNPLREGYTFKGWSNNSDCKGDILINSSISVNSGNTYYACYLKNVDSDESESKYYIWIIVFAISGLSLRLIWHLIYKFRCNEDCGNITDR